MKPLFARICALIFRCGRPVLAALLLGGLSVAPVWAQPTPAAGVDAQAERSRLQAERAALQAQYLEQQRACYQRFAVNDCLRQAKQAQRLRSDELRRQELVLNDAQRKRQALSQIDTIEANFSPARQQEQAQKERQAQDDQAQRERDAQERLDAAARPPEGAVRRPNAAPSPDPQYPQTQLDRQRQATQRQQDAQQRAQSADPKYSTPLPIPPGY
jgi:hypothetical protein